MLDDLDEMQSYLDPEYQVETPQIQEQRRRKSRQKLNEVFRFMQGK